MRRCLLPLLSVSLAGVLAGCGGGEEPAPAVSAQAGDATAAVRRTVQGLTDSQRIAAATATAGSSTNACSTVRPFYWEIGAASGKLAAGSVNSGASTTTYNANTPMAIASASKWLYASYVAQKRGGVLSASDIKFLTLRSGYTNMYTACTSTQTVDACLNSNGNGTYNPNTDNRFYYGSGHMQKHASGMGLGAMLPKALATEVQSQLGTDLAIGYNQPAMAIGAYATPDAYARFLRKLMNKQLKMGSLLGSNKVCTSPSACGLNQALVSPVSSPWHYSLGHWVEDDAGGDGSFNSLGALGFYPWIDATRSYYGVLARMADGGMDGSRQCGQLIRKAWTSGTSL
ncbi:hypothetical protein [Aquabacterium sp.]|uniref:hypothetical protein n=1 Tax=Aquabacterium sp. TaxID=1872578 RepID=UPI003783DE8B